ncbi:MAG: ABC transporter ATP-binding protein, partial [Rudaea sp.]
RTMTASGRSIVFISHKLNEPLEIADRITVMQRGHETAVGIDPHKTTKHELARLMVGRDIMFRLDKKSVEPGEVVLEIEDLRALNDKGIEALRGISLQVRSGEILGVAGVAGNGQSELAQVITGLRKISAGHIRVHGEELGNRTALKALETGVAHIPEDRAGVGSAPSLSVAENLIMKSYRRAPIADGFRINQKKARQTAENLKREYQIATPSIDTQARLLSGGNLQRLILAREITTKPRLMVAVHPTRGLDVGATEAVHRLLLQQREARAAILLISEDLDEILALADRIAVIYEGEIVGTETGVKPDIEKIGLMMAGTRPAPPADRVPNSEIQRNDNTVQAGLRDGS